LGNRLAQATEQRAALTQQLLDVRDEERLALARELHDEFGQNLTAIPAFASTIEAARAAHDARVAQDARMISRATSHLMTCLRGTLSRLRRPLAAEVGLEASLIALTECWQHAARPIIRLDLQGDLADVHGPVAVTAYRVAQECLTN